MTRTIGILVALLIMLPLLIGGIAAAADDTLGSIVKLSGDIVVPAGHTVNGDVVAIAGNIEVLGTVNGNVVSVMGNVTIQDSGMVRGDTVAVLGNLKVLSGGSILGNQVAVVGQGFRNIPVHNWSFRIHRPHFPGVRYGAKSAGLVFQVLITALLVSVAPQAVGRVEGNIRKNPVAAGAIGLLTIFAGSALIFVTAITIIGIPLALLLGALLGIVCLVGKYLGGAAIGLWVGQALFKGEQSPMASAIIGSLLIGAVLMIPFTGLIGAVVSLVALGGVIASNFGLKGEEISHG